MLQLNKLKIDGLKEEKNFSDWKVLSLKNGLACHKVCRWFKNVLNEPPKTS